MRSSSRRTSLARSPSEKKTAAYARSTMSSDESLISARSPLTVFGPSPESTWQSSLGYSEDTQRHHETNDSQQVHPARDERDCVIVGIEAEAMRGGRRVIADERSEDGRQRSPEHDDTEEAQCSPRLVAEHRRDPKRCDS